MSSDKLPKYLYKYSPINKRTIENLIKNQIYLNNPSKFNDPFECTSINFEELDVSTLYTENPEKFANRTLEECIKPLQDGIKESISKNSNKIGCFCLSSKKDEILMWSHYADKHSGICIEFDTIFKPFDKAQKVIYQPEFMQFDLKKFMNKTDTSEYKKLLIHKFNIWKYEQEYRIIKPTSQTFNYNKNAIRTIYFGINCSNEDKETIKNIFSNSNIKFVQVTKDIDFKLNIGS